MSGLLTPDLAARPRKLIPATRAQLEDFFAEVVHDCPLKTNPRSGFGFHDSTIAAMIARPLNSGI